MIIGTCAQLLVPSFGQLLLESSNSDITQTQSAVNISTGDRVIIQCAEGYELALGDANTLLSASRSSITCMDGGAWSVDITDLACVKQSGEFEVLCAGYIVCNYVNNLS